MINAPILLLPLWEWGAGESKDRRIQPSLHGGAAGRNGGRISAGSSPPRPYFPEPLPLMPKHSHSWENCKTVVKRSCSPEVN